MSDDPEIYRFDPKDGGGKQGLTDFLNIALETERWQAIRAGLAEWLVWIGMPLWVMAAWPGHLWAGVVRLVLSLWGTVGAIFLVAQVTEWKWRWRKCESR